MVCSTRWGENLPEIGQPDIDDFPQPDAGQQEKQAKET